MERIPLKVANFAGGLRILARIQLSAKEPHIFGFIEAIVDTGSPKTIIGPSDLKKMRVSTLGLKKLEGRKNPIQLGGGNLVTKILNECNIKINGRIDVTMPLDIPVDCVGGETQPTILGIDFLIESKCSLFLDPIKRIAYLEREAPETFK